MKNKLKTITTLSVEQGDRKRIRELAAKYDCKQYEIVSALVKLEKQFKPELKMEVTK